MSLEYRSLGSSLSSLDDSKLTSELCLCDVSVPDPEESEIRPGISLSVEDATSVCTSSSDSASARKLRIVEGTTSSSSGS